MYILAEMKVLPPSFARQCRISSDTSGIFDVGNSYIMNIVLENICYKNEGVSRLSESKYVTIQKRLFL